jgi:hypothetical protein
VAFLLAGVFLLLPMATAPMPNRGFFDPGLKWVFGLVMTDFVKRDD